MKKLLLFISIIAFLIFVALPNNVTATSGACSWHGGVNCAAGSDWDGSVICNDGWRDSSVSYYSMVMCQGYYDYPSYTPSIPDCPFMSHYDSLSGSCKCYSGYIASGGKCISTDQYCRDLLGYNARYNILTDSCECSYGYILSGGICISGDSYCRNKHGIFSSYQSFSDSCKCEYGYVFDSYDQCVSRDDNCQDLYGYHAEYNILTDNCVCQRGYVFNSSMTECIDGDSYCRDNYGFYASYDYWEEKCKCDSGYVVSNNKCIDGDTYCRNKYGIHSSYDSLTKICECDYGYKLKDDECVTPEISRIFPLEVEIGEEVTIQGENFGDSKYGDLNPYIGSIKVNSLDISKWQDDKIIFEVGEYLESGYVALEGGTTDVRGSYLEILEPEEDFTPIYTFKPKQESEQEPESGLPQQEEIQTEEQQESLEFQTVEETQLDTQPDTEESQPSEIQESENKEQQEVNNEQEQEQKQDQKRSLSVFLASVFDAIKNFFLQFFR